MPRLHHPYRTHSLLSVLLFFPLAAAAATAGEAPLIPMRHFFKNPEAASFQISPDGKKIAYLKPWQRRMNIFVSNTDGSEERQITAVSDRDIAGFAWKGSDRIIFMRDTNGDENVHPWLVEATGGEARDLTPYEGVLAHVLDILREDPNHILISIYQYDPASFDVYRCNLATGELQMAAENPDNVTVWMTDHSGKVRIAVRIKGLNRTVLYRREEGMPFEEMVTTDFNDTFQPLAFTFDNRRLYVLSNHAESAGKKCDKTGIHIYDPETRRYIDEVFSHPEVDVDDILVSSSRRLLTGVVYTTDRQQFHFLDTWRETLQRTLEKRLPGYDVTIVNMDDAERKGVCIAHSDRVEGKYYLFDHDSKEPRLLADSSPWLKEENMAATRAITFQSRDDLTIHGYLTLPAGLPTKNLPLVVVPHGGPQSRDVWGFNPESQFIANRGAAVLRVNFRGSTGYGREFWQAGFKQWGRGMQNDVSDGVLWLVRQGIADPRRVAIYGASYGGYSALVGLAFTPELYACGISYAGPSNLFTMLAGGPSYWEPMREMEYRQVGHPEQDKEMLTAVSPFFHADRIRAPLLVAQGANDPRVEKAESDQIVEAVRKQGHEVIYLLKDDEGHGFANEENKFAFYRVMERFLAAHLGLRQE